VGVLALGPAAARAQAGARSTPTIPDPANDKAGDRPRPAEPPSEYMIERAHQAFLVGQAAFNGGRYEEALAHFRESYRLSARPELLLTLAQTTRKLGHFDEAIAFIDRYLASDPPRAMLRPTYEFLGQLRAERKAAQARAAPATQPTGALVATPRATAPAPAPADKRRRSLVIGLAVGGAVLLVAAGVTLGVVLGTTPSNRYPDTGLGTVGFAR
jgi:tetratricopeptide (TPR) repeat protein